MTLYREQFSLNTIQWITVTLSEAGDPSPIKWDFDLSTFLAKQPRILAQVREAGFSSVMLEVLPTQTLQSYARVVAESGLSLSPGYIHIGLPEEYGHDFTHDVERQFRWFDEIRRRAEQTAFMGLNRIFLAAEVAPGRPRMDVAAAVGHDFDRSRLDRVANLLGSAAEVLSAEGIVPALHNHVGTWVETEDEIDYVLDAISPSLLTAGPDIGHLAWTGVDVVAWVAAHRDRISDLHVKDMDLSIARASRESPTPYFSVIEQPFFFEPGLGDVPLAQALAELPDDFSGAVIIEVDKPSMEPFESAKKSWEWVAANYPETQR